MSIIDVQAVGFNRIQAVFLKGHLKMLALGMKNSQISGTEMLRKASAMTGKAYKRGQYEVARNDLTALLEANQ